MIPPFTLKAPPQILFGPGKFSELQTIVARFGGNPLLVLGGHSFLRSQYFEQLKDMISSSQSGLQMVHIDQEPSPDLIDFVVKKYRDKEIGCIIGLGGGSVLDAAKAISAMLAEQSHVVDFLEGVGTQHPSGNKLPFIAIPTTSGTGSEATSNAVISKVGENGFKKSLRHDNYIPNIAIIDPQLTLSCPQSLTVSCGMDCFSQLVEGYLSTNGSTLTDMLALEGINGIKRSLRVVCREGDNIAARTDLSYAALLSGIVLANAGLGSVHGFASVIGGLFSIPHGIVCGSLMAPVNAYTLKGLKKSEKNHHPSLKKYTTLGKIFSSKDHKSDDWYQDFFIAELHHLSEILEIPRLSNYGITKLHIGRIARKTANKYNPFDLSEGDRADILHSRLS